MSESRKCALNTFANKLFESASFLYVDFLRGNEMHYTLCLQFVYFAPSQVGDMRDELLKAADVNVIVVDWAGGSLPLYTQATANTRLVGMEIANLINFLIVSTE